MTTIAPPPISPDAPHFDVTEPLPLVRVHANLMPDEIISKRAVRAIQRRLVIAIIAIIALLGAAYAYTRQETSSAEDDLANAKQSTVVLQSKAAQFAPLQSAQAQVGQIQATLATIMTGDLQWSELMRKLQASAGKGVVITGLTGNVGTGDSTGASPSANPLAAPGVTVVGSLTINGTAPDSTSVGKFVNTLSKVPGLTDLVPTSVTGKRGAYTFAINLSLTTQALGGRFSPTTPAAAPSSAVPSAGATPSSGS